MNQLNQGGEVEDSKPYDLSIIGAGPGGYVAGIRAAQLGLKACVIEKDQVGGVCLNWGCIPSKNLIHQASLLDSTRELRSIGVAVDASGLDYAKVNKNSRKAAQILVKGIAYLLKENKVPVLKGTATIAGPGELSLEDGTRIRSRNILIATGSRPFTLPGFEFDESRVMSSNGILAMSELPKSLIILGAGAIGCEFAYIMSAFGVKVTLVEMAGHLLPLEDEETVAVLAKSFKKRGIDIRVGTRALCLERGEEAVSVLLEGPEGQRSTIEAEKALCVFGRIPNTDSLGLETVGIQTERGYIPVGPYGETRVPGIYAIGDVVKTPQLAHVASKEAEIAVAHMAGRDEEEGIRIDEVPSAIYCEPQVASFGLREAQALQDNIPFKKTIFPYRGIGKAKAIGKPDGMIKILHDPAGSTILGTHIVGHDATEVLHEVLLAKASGILPETVSRMIHAHPTISELVMEGLGAVAGRAVHAAPP
jgi:dihydrolipoyl dehydrogenase